MTDSYKRRRADIIGLLNSALIVVGFAATIVAGGLWLGDVKADAKAAGKTATQAVEALVAIHGTLVEIKVALAKVEQRLTDQARRLDVLEGRRSESQ